MGLNLPKKTKPKPEVWIQINNNPPKIYSQFYDITKNMLSPPRFEVIKNLAIGESIIWRARGSSKIKIKRVPPPIKQSETNEGTGAAGGASTGAFSGPFFEPIRREINEGLNLSKKKPHLEIVGGEYMSDNYGTFVNMTIEQVQSTLSNVDEYEEDDIFYDVEGNTYTLDDLIGRCVKVGNKIIDVEDDGIDDGIDDGVNADDLLEGLNLPKKEKCPICGSKNTRPDYDNPTQMTNCESCGSEWNKSGDITFDAGEEQICPNCGSYEIENLGYNYDTAHIDYKCSDCDFHGAEFEFSRRQINEQKQLNMGKLKLLEVLTSADIQQIKSLASTEANKVKSDLKSDIDKIDKNLAKHSQDKDSHLKTKDIKDIVKPDIDKLKDETTKLGDRATKFEKSVEDKIDKATDSKEIDKKVRELIADTMVKYHQTLWIKRGFWTSGLTK